jgi:hypothetical protein
MAVLAGRNADIYIASVSGTGMTGEATTSLGSGVYQITDAAKRAINPNTTFTVLDGVATVPTSRYQVAYGTGKVYFQDYTPAGTITVTGEYLTLAQAAQGFEWTLDVQPMLEETQTFGDSWKERTCVMRDATCSFQRFYEDEYFFTNGDKYFVIACYLNVSGADRYVFGAMLSSQGTTSGVNETVKQNVQFSAHGVVDYASS